MTFKMKVVWPSTDRIYNPIPRTENWVGCYQRLGDACRRLSEKGPAYVCSAFILPLWSPFAWEICWRVYSPSLVRKPRVSWSELCFLPAKGTLVLMSKDPGPPPTLTGLGSHNTGLGRLIMKVFALSVFPEMQLGSKPALTTTAVSTQTGSVQWVLLESLSSLPRVVLSLPCDCGVVAFLTVWHIYTTMTRSHTRCLVHMYGS